MFFIQQVLHEEHEMNIRSSIQDLIVLAMTRKYSPVPLLTPQLTESETSYEFPCSSNFQIWGANTCAIMAKPRTCLRPSERQRVT